MSVDVEYLVLQLVFAAWINELMLLATRPLPNDSLLQRLHASPQVSMRCSLPGTCDRAAEDSSDDHLHSNVRV